ncbi:hypothetical protein RJ640_018722, partial [Escallonia rubra]
NSQITEPSRQTPTRTGHTPVPPRALPNWKPVNGTTPKRIWKHHHTREFDFGFVVPRTLEYNQLSGTIPPELGNLPRLERIRIGDNHYTENIPNFIQNWTNLEKLFDNGRVVQASGVNGPIPSGIALLTKLTDLRISDLNGTDATFPPLSSIKNLKTLILRSCNIIGPLPDDLGEMSKLKILDLTFNKLSGKIPGSFTGLLNTDYIYLTGNLLAGPMPDWMMKEGDNINLFGSASRSNLSGAVSCLRSTSQCQKNWHSLDINCGGRETSVDGNIEYEDDTDSSGPSRFFQSRTNWALSSTGHFLDDDSPRDSFIWTSTLQLSVNNSNSLHFADIMFSDDNLYSSLGRRIFDVYIQLKTTVMLLYNEDIGSGGAWIFWWRGSLRRKDRMELGAFIRQHNYCREVAFFQVKARESRIH